MHEIIHWLLTNQYWLAVQGIFQNYGGLLSIGAVIAYWHASCDAHTWCWRPGKHTVDGTSWKVCSNHHTKAHHERLHILHRDKHPDRHAVK